MPYVLNDKNALASLDEIARKYKDLTDKSKEYQSIITLTIHNKERKIDLLDERNVAWMVKHLIKTVNISSVKDEKKWFTLLYQEPAFLKALFNLDPQEINALLSIKDASHKQALFTAVFYRFTTHADNVLPLFGKKKSSLLVLINNLGIENAEIVEPSLSQLIECWHNNHFTFNEFKIALINYLLYKEPPLFLYPDRKQDEKERQFQKNVDNIRKHLISKHKNTYQNILLLKEKDSAIVNGHFCFNLDIMRGQDEAKQHEYIPGGNPICYYNEKNKKYYIVGANTLEGKNKSGLVSGMVELSVDILPPSLREKIQSKASHTIELEKSEREYLIEQGFHQPSLMMMGSFIDSPLMPIVNKCLAMINSGKKIDDSLKQQMLTLVLIAFNGSEKGGMSDEVIDHLIMRGNVSDSLIISIEKMQESKKVAAKIMENNKNEIDEFIFRLKVREKLKQDFHPYFRLTPKDISFDEKHKPERKSEIEEEKKEMPGIEEFKPYSYDAFIAQAIDKLEKFDQKEKNAEWEETFKHFNDDIETNLRDVRKAILARESFVIDMGDKELGQVRVFAKKEENISIDKYDIFGIGLDYAMAALEIVNKTSEGYRIEGNFKLILRLFQQDIANSRDAMQAKEELKSFTDALCSLLVKEGCCDSMKEARKSLDFVRNFLWKQTWQKEAFCSAMPESKSDDVVLFRIVKPISVKRDGNSPWEKEERESSVWYKNLKKNCGNKPWFDKFVDNHVDELSELATTPMLRSVPGPSNAYDSTLIVAKKEGEIQQVLHGKTAAITEPFKMKDKNEKTKFTINAHQDIVFGKELSELQKVAEQQAGRWHWLKEIEIPILNQTLIANPFIAVISPDARKSSTALKNKSAANQVLRNRLNAHNYFYDRTKNRLIEVAKDQKPPDNSYYKIKFTLLETNNCVNMLGRLSGTLPRDMSDSRQLVDIAIRRLEMIKPLFKDKNNNLEKVIEFLKTPQSSYDDDLDQAIENLTFYLREKGKEWNDVALLLQSSVELSCVIESMKHRHGQRKIMHKATHEQIIAEVLGMRFGGCMSSEDRGEEIEAQKEAFIKGFYLSNRILRFNDAPENQIAYLEQYASTQGKHIFNKMTTGIAASKDRETQGMSKEKEGIISSIKETPAEQAISNQFKGLRKKAYGGTNNHHYLEKYIDKRSELSDSHPDDDILIEDESIEIIETPVDEDEKKKLFSKISGYKNDIKLWQQAINNLSRLDSLKNVLIQQRDRTKRMGSSQGERKGYQKTKDQNTVLMRELELELRECEIHLLSNIIKLKEHQEEYKKKYGNFTRLDRFKLGSLSDEYAIDTIWGELSDRIKKIKEILSITKEINNHIDSVDRKSKPRIPVYSSKQFGGAVEIISEAKLGERLKDILKDNYKESAATSMKLTSDGSSGPFITHTDLKEGDVAIHTSVDRAVYIEKVARAKNQYQLDVLRLPEKKGNDILRAKNFADVMAQTACDIKELLEEKKLISPEFWEAFKGSPEVTVKSIETFLRKAHDRGDIDLSHARTKVANQLYEEYLRQNTDEYTDSQGKKFRAPNKKYIDLAADVAENFIVKNKLPIISSASTDPMLVLATKLCCYARGCGYEDHFTSNLEDKASPLLILPKQFAGETLYASQVELKKAKKDPDAGRIADRVFVVAKKLDLPPSKAEVERRLAGYVGMFSPKGDK